jgi:hypothetical protein
MPVVNPGPYPTSSDVFHSPNFYINGVNVALWNQGTTEAAFVQQNGVAAIVDDTVDQPDGQAALQKYGITDPKMISIPTTGSNTVIQNANTDMTMTKPQDSNTTDCGGCSTDPNFQLSTNIKLVDLTTGTVFPHSLVAQHGLTELQLVCNLKALASNPLEAVCAKYGKPPKFNSGFRTGDGKSQHERGQACDIQWPGISHTEYLTRAQWIRDNVNFDQLILEHGNTLWIHVSWNKDSVQQRKSVITMFQGQYTQGLTLHYT